jgi:hypothetical protein
MRPLLVVAVTLLFAMPLAAQDVSVPGVTTASPGGYANPLKLDTDKAKRAKSGERRWADTPFGYCNDRQLSKSQLAALEAGYTARARSSERTGVRWLRDQCGANAAWYISRSVQRRTTTR